MPDKSLYNAYDWRELLLNRNPTIDFDNNELGLLQAKQNKRQINHLQVYGPVSIRALTQTTEIVQAMIVRRHIFEFLFHPGTTSSVDSSTTLKLQMPSTSGSRRLA